jgi:toxin ParE1/3/4
VSQAYALTSRARRDLASIRDYIVQDSPMAGVRFIEGLMAKFDQIAFSPFMAQAIASNPRFRRLPHGAYVIFYEVTDDRVIIRSIEHSATLK